MLDLYEAKGAWMISKRFYLFKMLPVLAVLAASQAIAQSNQEQMHHRHTGGEGEVQAQLPPLTILMPENGATVGTRLAVVFRTPADLSKMAMGTPAPGAHLHIEAQDASVMPEPRTARPPWRRPLSVLVRLPSKARQEHLANLLVRCTAPDYSEHGSAGRRDSRTGRGAMIL